MTFHPEQVQKLWQAVGLYSEILEGAGLPPLSREKTMARVNEEVIMPFYKNGQSVPTSADIFITTVSKINLSKGGEN